MAHIVADPGARRHIAAEGGQGLGEGAHIDVHLVLQAEVAGRTAAALADDAEAVGEEFRRVLRPGGAFIQVTAGEDHLLALRSLIYETVRRKQPEPDPVLPGFALERSELVEFSFALEDNAAVMALLAMTPHYLRITKEGLVRARAAEGLQDRAQARFRIYRRTEDVL